MPNVRTHHRRGYLRRDGTYVPPTVVSSHDRQPPRTVEVAEAIVRPFMRSGYFRQDGSFVASTLVEAHVRQAHRRSKPRR